MSRVLRCLNQEVTERQDAIREIAAEALKRDSKVPADRRPFAFAELPFVGGVSLLAGGTSLVLITPRETPLRTLERHPQVVMIDDADKLLKEIVISGRDNNLGLVFGASTDGFQTSMGGWPTTTSPEPPPNPAEPGPPAPAPPTAVQIPLTTLRA